MSKLHQAHVGAVVLVPLQHGALVHPGVLDRHHLAHRPLGEHHAARSGSPGAAGNFNNSLAIATTGVVGYVVIGPS
jgi:hypothetical protein